MTIKFKAVGVSSIMELLLSETKRTGLFLLLILGIVGFVTAQPATYRYTPVSGWSGQVNDKLEAFLNSTKVIQTRKVAVFDCDGTLFGQVPYYLADEAIYDYAAHHYQGKNDARSQEKMAIIKRLKSEDNTSQQYVQDRIDFLSGMRVEEVERMGKDCFHEKYQQKFYPQMRCLLADLKDYGFEIWVVSASPELLYQGFVHEGLGIPKDRILGVKSVIHHDSVTSQIVFPVPQDGGKADLVQTQIKAQPLFAAGNSRGDMELMLSSIGLKMIINPDQKKVETAESAGQMKGHTVLDFWRQQPATVIVSCEDVPNLPKGATNDTYFTTAKEGIKANAAHAANEYE
ncbi:HAD family hydrolase [Arachidicoccus terrestris]|uniref:HAD family hydrolase n=1 Tax=Arachidicoccus terrestris TaxID=2875539 RepID=UPI001CC82C6F|nr:haloacid dehalogenase-like hydrolase [Arachidicoccus terrestris]UAY55590.1 haloacid dehalogenase-like hydrolase [Arachidicoccus terrestris]